MQNRVRGLKSGTELGQGFNSAAPHLSLPDTIVCLTGLFKPVIHTLSTYLETYVPIFASDYIIFAF